MTARDSGQGEDRQTIAGWAIVMVERERKGKEDERRVCYTYMIKGGAPHRSPK